MATDIYQQVLQASKSGLWDTGEVDPILIPEPPPDPETEGEEEVVNVKVQQTVVKAKRKPRSRSPKPKRRSPRYLCMHYNMYIRMYLTIETMT